MKQEIKFILQGLTNKNPSDAIIVERTFELLDARENIHAFMDDMKKEIRRIKDFHGDREPFYYVYLAAGYFEQKDYKQAKEALAYAVQGFRLADFTFNVALTEWFFSIIHHEDGNETRSLYALETTAAILNRLIKQCEDESKYNKAGEYTEYLKRLEKFRASLEASQCSKKDPIPQAQSTAGDPSRAVPFPELHQEEGLAKDNVDELFHHEELLKNQTFLKRYHTNLKNRFENLRLQQKRVPPTLVATIFYIYKILIPSHSVYRTIPTPATVREKTAYEELLRRVGSFEVIEQLVEMEQEFLPQASRQELLEKIIRDWDLDINRQKASGG